MMIGITGTPGCGKTSAAEELRRRGFTVLDLKTTVKDYVIEHDDELGSDIIDDEEWANNFPYTQGFVEGAFAHYLTCDKIIVLRCRPDVLKKRLAPRGYSAEKVRENLEAEALDVILIETADAFASEQIYEIDTTNIKTDIIADKIVSFANDDVESSFGELDWSEYVNEL
ncbi:MAG: adenylate kinase family protein [Methanocorpusculum sp.]|nr:adenylate kinase family protein [Methanocorpusculum sp.]